METTQQALVTVDPLEILRPTLSEKLAAFQERLSVAVLALEDESLTVAESLDAIQTLNPIEAEELGERLKVAVEFSDRAIGFFEPWRELFRGPYQAVLDRKKGVLDVVATALQNAKRRLLTWEREENERREAAARIEQDRLRREEDERKLALATDAESAGLSEQAVTAILETPSTAPTPTAAPIQRPTGVSARKNWQAEVFDADKLFEAAVKDKSLRVYFLFNESALNKAAKIYESALAIPGVRAVNAGSLAVRR